MTSIPFPSAPWRAKAHRTMRRQPLLWATGIALLAGCASPGTVVGPMSQLRDAGDLASSRTLAALAPVSVVWPTVQWWSRYGDPQLDRILTTALSNHPTLRMAQARIRLAGALSGSAEAAQSVQINGSLKDTRQRYSAHSNVPPPIAGTWRTFNDATLSASYEFDFWGRNQAVLEAALGRERAAEVDAQATRLMLASSTVQTYLRLARHYSELALAEQVVVRREALVELTRQRRQAGLDSDLELRQADSAVPPARQKVAALQESIMLTRQQLAALCGQGPDWALVLQVPRLALALPFGLPSTVPAELVGRRPDVVAQRWRVDAASRDIGAARSQFYPNVSLTAFAGLQSLGLDQFLNIGSRTAGIGPAITLPIFDGGRLRANLGARSAEYDVAVEQYNLTLVDALQDVVVQLTSLHWIEQQRREQSIAVQSTEAAFQLATQRYKAGTGNYLQVLATELQMQAQQATLIELQARALQLDASLIRALGGGTLEHAPQSIQ